MVYLILVVIAFILIALALECILKRVSILNIAAAFLLLILAIFIGASGLKDYLFTINRESLSFLALKIQNFSLVLFGPVLYIFSLYFPRDENSKSAKKSLLMACGVFFIPGLCSLLGADIAQFSSNLEYNIHSHSIYRMIVIYKPLHYLLLSLSFLLFSYSIIRIYLKNQKALLVYQKKQVYYFFIGFTGCALFYLLGILFYQVFPEIISILFKGAAFLAFGSLILYSVINYRFINIRGKVWGIGKEVVLASIVSLPIVIVLFIFRFSMIQLSPVVYFIVMVPSFALFFWLFQLFSTFIKKFIGIEIDPGYYAIAENRIREAASQMLLPLGM